MHNHVCGYESHRITTTFDSATLHWNVDAPLLPLTMLVMLALYCCRALIVYSESLDCQIVVQYYC